MVTREKRRDVAGSYPVVFEACVRTVESFELPGEQQSMMGSKGLLRIQSANAQAGVITARSGEAWSVEIHVGETEGKCSVSVKLLSNEQGTDPLRGMFRWIDEFFDALGRISREILAKSREHFD